jgi:hypothetical protein
MGGTQSQQGGYEKKKEISGILSGIKLQVFSCINHKLITTMTELSNPQKQGY